MSRTFLFTIIIMFAVSCEPPKQGSSGSPGEVVRQTWPDGSPKLEMPVKDGKRNGNAKRWYQNGKLRQEIEYVNDIKHGKSVAYYESGNIHRISYYTEDELDGKRTQYWDNGTLKSEVTYKMGQPCNDLREFYADGSPVTKYPELLVREVDEIFTRNMVTLVVRPSEKVKKILFYRGVLGDGGCFDDARAIQQAPQSEQEYRIYYPLPPGTFRMEDVYLMAIITTGMGNPYIVEKVYPLAVENRG